MLSVICEFTKSKSSTKSIMFNTKTFSILVLLCHFLSLCVVIHGGGGSRRPNTRYSLGWNGNYQGNRNMDDDSRFEMDNGLNLKKALGLTKVVFSPIIIPMILFVGIVLLLFFAVVGSSAVVGGALGRRVPYRHVWAKSLSSTAKLASDVLESEQCVERISCEIFYKSKGLQSENWILRTLESLPIKSSWIGRIARSMKSNSECQEFLCPSVNRISKALKMLQ